jgi:hypothetical protein
MKQVILIISQLSIALIIATGFLYLVSCEKGDEKPAGNNKIEVSATSIEVVSYDWSDFRATITGFDSNRVNISNHGFYWSKSPNPDLNSSIIELGPRTEYGSFNTRLSNLEERKKYYVRAFANIPGGTLLSPSSEFTTLERGPATVKTDSLNNILESIATCFSSVLSDGGYHVIARGVCWNTSGNPTLQNCLNFTTDGEDTGSFISKITELTASTIYYLRAYATNSRGTSYDDDDVSFTTLAPWTCGTVLSVTHKAGSISPVNKTVNYSTVQTNLTGSNKCWITQNLGSDHQATSATDATEASAGWYWQFNRKQGFKHDGTIRTPNTTWIISNNELSDWLPANDPCTLLLSNGWRLPTETEWEMADSSGDWHNCNETFASVLKLHTSGFIANNNELLYNRGLSGYYWSSSQLTSSYGQHLYFGGFCNTSYSDKSSGIPVRCLRD